MTDEEGGGIRDVETEKNSKDRTAGCRHQKGCLCRKGTRVESSNKCGPGDACRVRLNLTTLTVRVFGEWNCLPCSTVHPWYWKY